MTRSLHRAGVATATTILIATLGQPASAQTRLPKPIIGTPTVLEAPSSLTATATAGQVRLVFSPVANAQGYRITRKATTISTSPETVLVELAASAFTAVGFDCTTTPAQSSCTFTDTKVNRRTIYTYRVWTVYPGGVVSPPSQPAAAIGQ